ncbi:sialidase family protein [Asanoa sp. WMMD1127]|uniref:sialidase family protein n=1 Tax=Asanoa sp. WMMD1127 TaxID=3016107 RepID=UPI002416155D|nr:sialidase family protein [Asanoa sp. WMMD1127]MDG4820780.1 sialidase family protein [Asanoa sp. WMMD1127]
MSLRRLTTQRRWLGASVAVLTVAALAVGHPAAAGGGADTTTLSGPSPLAGCVAGPAGEVVATNTELEPWLAVDRSRPGRMAVAWQQDRRARGNAQGIVVAATADGGRAWQEAPAPGLTACTGGQHDRTGSPALSFGPTGVLYLSTGSITGFNVSTVEVSRSTDGGRSWLAPVPVIADNTVYWNDKPSVTADPTNPRLVYVTWNRGNIQLSRHQVMVARSTDGGATFAPPQALYQPTPDGAGTFGSQIVVLRDGSLLHVAIEKEFAISGPAPVVQSKVLVMRSADKGVTWTAPQTLVEQTINAPVLPDTGAPVPAQGINPDVAVDPLTGAVYVVWAQQGLSPADSDVALAMSLDNGRRWTRPVRVNQSPADGPARDNQAILPQVDVADDGTVAVSYYDFRANTPAAGTPTTLWLASCRSLLCAFDGDRWDERRLAGPFDLETALTWQIGPYLGSYVSLSHTASRFVAAYTATTGDPANPQDILVTSVPIRARG